MYRKIQNTVPRRGFVIFFERRYIFKVKKMASPRWWFWTKSVQDGDFEFFCSKKYRKISFLIKTINNGTRHTIEFGGVLALERVQEKEAPPTCRFFFIFINWTERSKSLFSESKEKIEIFGRKREIWNYFGFSA